MTKLELTMNRLSINQMTTLRMAFLNLSSDLSFLSDLSRLFHSFEEKFVEVQRTHQFLFEKAFHTLSLDLVL